MGPTSSCMPHSSSIVTQASTGKAISLPLTARCSSKGFPKEGFSIHASVTGGEDEGVGGHGQGRCHTWCPLPERPLDHSEIPVWVSLKQQDPAPLSWAAREALSKDEIQTNCF